MTMRTAARYMLRIVLDLSLGGKKSEVKQDPRSRDAEEVAKDKGKDQSEDASAAEK